MPYITRDDGEHFVIPSYRDVITVKSASNLKREILSLSSNYGEYITLQAKGAIQYEIAFSPDPGYLLGESIWYYFKRPLDMIYCEAIPNTTEALLVIVKDGSVYLDGSFPLESVPEELIIFLTQQNNFNIYLYGEVPISQTAEVGKFSFEPSSVKSFTILDTPVFPTLPLIKSYQLQRVEQVLSAHGIGELPVKKIVIGAVIVLTLWFMWMYMTSQREEVRQIYIHEVNPYQAFDDAMASPAPDQEINLFLEGLNRFFSMPGWSIKQIDYAHEMITAAVQSEGSNIQTLAQWAAHNGATLDMNPKGFTLSMHISVPNRNQPGKIYPVKQVMIKFIDNLALVYPGNHLKFSGFANKGVYTNAAITIGIDNLSPAAIGLIGNICKGMPLVLKNITLKQDAGLLTGTISIDALGN